MEQVEEVGPELVDHSIVPLQIHCMEAVTVGHAMAHAPT